MRQVSIETAAKRGHLKAGKKPSSQTGRLQGGSGLGTIGVGTDCPNKHVLDSSSFPAYSSESWMYHRTITVHNQENIEFCSACKNSIPGG